MLVKDKVEKENPVPEEKLRMITNEEEKEQENEHAYQKFPEIQVSLLHLSCLRSSDIGFYSICMLR